MPQLSQIHVQQCKSTEGKLKVLALTYGNYQQDIFYWSIWYVSNKQYSDRKCTEAAWTS